MENGIRQQGCRLDMMRDIAAQLPCLDLILAFMSVHRDVLNTEFI